MNFVDFARAHGVVIDKLVQFSSMVDSSWTRVPTTEHPKKRNGSYKFLGSIGWVINYATMLDHAAWRSEGAEVSKADNTELLRQVAEFERKQRAGHERAAARAVEMMARARPTPHSYLQIKGFKDALGFVTSDDELLVPMRHLRSNAVMGAQVIKWVPENLKHDKKMLPGMRAKGAVFRIGSPKAPRTWLVEGYATGLSVEAALKLLRLRDSVLVCFSAGNLIHVASQIGGTRIVCADNDASEAGEKAAKATGLPYCMSPVVREDMNDLHQRAGIFKLAELLMGAITAEVTA
jgi:putative DNA primase/helicase